MGSKIKRLLRELVSLDTVGSKNGMEVKALVERYLKEAGADFSVSEHEKDGVKSFAFIAGKPPYFVLNGHYDVVPPGDGWSSDPFSPVEKDDFIYGRGASDMKGGLSAIVDAFSNLSLKLRGKNKGGVILVVAGDEEKGGFKGTGSLVKGLCSNYELCGAMVTEPTCRDVFGDSIKPGRRGVVWFNVEVIGKGGHASMPEKALNPVEGIAALIEYFKSIKLENAPDMSPTSISPTLIESGSTAQNVIPRTARLWVDMRTNYALDLDRFLEEIKNFLSSKGFKSNIEVQIKVEAFMTKNEEFVGLLSQIVENKTGVKPSLTTAGGSSDARFFAYEGIPTVEFGPVARNMHANDEHVSIDEVELLSRIVEDFVLQWLSRKTE